MADLPILFSAPMVRGLIREVEHPGTGKTQTRRIINFPGVENVIEFVQVATELPSGVPVFEMKDATGRHMTRPVGKHLMTPHYSPRFAKGDRLWVKETWRTHRSHDQVKPSALLDGTCVVIVDYSADGDKRDWLGRNRVSIHMPRWASRLTLTVTDVRVERLQACSEADALAEGIQQHGRLFGLPDADWDDAELSAVAAYRRVWGQINGAASWAANPWIVALTFTVERRNIDAARAA